MAATQTANTSRGARGIAAGQPGSEAQMTILEGAPDCGPFDIREGEATFGRASFADCRIRNEYVSRLHFAIIRKGHDFQIEDRDSLNGVTLNNFKIDKPHRLVHNDEIVFGPVHCRFTATTPDTGGGKWRKLIIAGGVTAVIVIALLALVSVFGTRKTNPELLATKEGLRAAAPGAKEATDAASDLLRNVSADEAMLLAAKARLDENLGRSARALNATSDYLKASPTDGKVLADSRSELGLLVDNLKKVRIEIDRRLVPLQIERFGRQVSGAVENTREIYAEAFADARRMLDSETPDFAGAAKRCSDAERAAADARNTVTADVGAAALDDTAKQAILTGLTSSQASEASRDLERLKGICRKGLSYADRKTANDNDGAVAALEDLAKAGADYANLLVWITAERKVVQQRQGVEGESVYSKIVTLTEEGKKKEAYVLIKAYVAKYKDSDDPTIKANVGRLRSMGEILDNEAMKIYNEASRELDGYRHGSGDIDHAKSLFEEVLKTVGEGSKYAKFADQKLKEIAELKGTQ